MPFLRRKLQMVEGHASHEEQVQWQPAVHSRDGISSSEFLHFFLARRWVCVCYVNETPANIDMLSVHNRNAGKCIPTCRKSLRLNCNEGVVIQQKQLMLFQRLLELAENNEHLNYTKAYWSQWMSCLLYNSTGRWKFQPFNQVEILAFQLQKVHD